MNKTIYTPRQIFWGTFFGGPFALIYLLTKNFKVLEKQSSAQKTVFLGLPLSIALLLLLVIIPMRISTPVFIACAFVGENISRDQQFQKLPIPVEFTLQSTWRVFFVTLACLLAWAATVFLILFCFNMAGIAIDA